MRNRPTRIWLLLIFAAICPSAVWTAPKEAPPKQTALDRYVAEPDPAYRFQLVATIPGKGMTGYVLDLTSQHWRTPAEVNRTEWRHWLTIVVPDQVKHQTGFLFIGGSSNASKPPSSIRPDFAEIASVTGTVVAELRMVPNQPLTFTGETEPRSEDALIAYGWDKFLRGGDDRWLARLPMTKSAVRAMDAITSFCSGEQAGKRVVNKFVVAGASKRGWTTWTTAAVDKRVVAIVPLVIDLLNLEPSFRHHYRAYGFWAPAIKDYVDLDIMSWTGHPRYRKLLDIEDPYSYRDRLTLPKLMINASGDQFFLPDSAQFFFDDLPGEKHVRYIPNTDHSLGKTDVMETLIAFYDSVLNSRARPAVSWTFDRKGQVRVKTGAKPDSVKLWQAWNPKQRDFRLETLGPVWKESPVSAEPGGDYVARVQSPSAGWTAYFVEMTFPSGGKYPLKVTTPIRVTPDKLPFSEYKPKPRK